MRLVHKIEVILVTVELVKPFHPFNVRKEGLFGVDAYDILCRNGIGEPQRADAELKSGEEG